MLFANPMPCPKCGGESHVYNSSPPRRYRRCLNKACRFIWRTQEILQREADEMTAWYTDQTEEGGGGFAALMVLVGQLYEHARQLGEFLGWEGGENDDGLSVSAGEVGASA
jgi:hypothetical protein